VFSGGADLRTTERVCAEEAAAQPPTGIEDSLSTLDELVRHSLIRAEIGPGGTRYRMLETIREFALERLTESGEASMVRRRHAEWCTELVESMAPLGGNRAAEAEAVGPELDNIRSALEWAAETEDAAVGLRICGAAWHSWERWQRLREGLTWTHRFLALDGREELAPYRIRALETAGGIAYWLGDAELAVAAYRERLVLATRYATVRDVADAHLDLMFGLSNVGDRSAAQEELAAARSGYEAADDELGLARCDWVTSSWLMLERRFGEARVGLERVLAVFREHGDVNFASLAIGSLAMSSLAVGDLPAADLWFREILTMGEVANTVALISGLGTWSRLLGRLGHPRLAARFEGAYEALSETYGVQYPPRLREIVDFVLAQAGPGEELDADERQRLMEEGQRLTLDGVLEVARTLGDEAAGSAELESLALKPAVPP
jgi:hypothetical protein